MNENIKSLIPGFVSTTVTHGIGYPLYTIKTRLQIGTHNTFNDCIIRTINKEGYKAFYRGFASPLLSGYLVRPFEMALFEKINKKYNSYISGVIVTFITGTINTPISAIKIIMQTTTYKEHKNIYNAIKNTYNDSGIKMFFSGYNTNIVYYLCIGFVYFGTYGYIRDKILGDTFNINRYLYFSVISSCILKISLYPIDTIRTIAQKYNYSVIESIRYVIKNNIYFRGAYPTLLYLIPVHTTSILLYEIIRNHIK